jgi:hypothetical protein
MAANLAALEFLALLEEGELSSAAFAAASLVATDDGIPLPVESSVGQFFWDIDAGELTVHFTDGSTYTYPIARTEVAAVVGAPSAGAFFNRVSARAPSRGRRGGPAQGRPCALE